MNHDELQAASSIDSHRDVVDALLDGESVGKDALREALARADAREYFIDMLLLRRLANDMGPNAYRVAGRPLTPATRAIRWVATAALLVATATGSYLVGRDHRSPGSPSRSATVEVATTVSEAPAPTRTIRFEPGKNWLSNLEEE